MLRKEACSGSIHDLAHIPTQNCLAECLTKASAKADNLITVVQTGTLPDVDIHLDFRTLMEHKAFLSTWCKTFLHTREKEVVFLNTHKISLVQTPQGGPFQVMFARNSAYQGTKGIENAVRSRYYENNVCSRRITQPISLVNNADSDDTTYVDGEEYFQSKHHQGSHRGDR